MSSLGIFDSTIAIARHAPALRRRTKIVATLGPSTDHPDTLVSLMLATSLLRQAHHSAHEASEDNGPA